MPAVARYEHSFMNGNETKVDLPSPCVFYGFEVWLKMKQTATPAEKLFWMMTDIDAAS